MAYDELELDRIGDQKTAVFFIISDTTQTYNFLVALAFSQMFNLLCERADNVHGGRLPHHVRVLWDEAANTGQVPQLEKLVAVIRSREVSLCLLYQQLAQCKAIYDKHAETILGNMDSVVFLGGREASTIKEISENWLGKATISMQTDSRSRGQSESYSQNTQRLGRELMTPAELATMPGDKCILQLRGLPPFFSPKYDLKRHPNYRYTAEADKQKNAFDLDRLINRRRRPGLNEACTMYEVAVPDDALTEEDEDILNYPTMSIEELCALPVADLAAPDSALFLWATFPQLPEALRLIEAWGFTYKSVAFVWLKKNKKADSWFYGLGFWTRGNAEICLLATKGHPKRQAANIHQFIISPIEAHSKKPDEARAKIISLMGDLPRVELFARQTPPGWAVWGNEVTPTIPDFGTHCPEVQKGV